LCTATSRLQHSKSCQAAYFAPDGSGHLLTTCYDDLLRVWKPKPSPGGGVSAINSDPTSALKIKHNNQTGRWVLPFRAVRLWHFFHHVILQSNHELMTAGMVHVTNLTPGSANLQGGVDSSVGRRRRGQHEARGGVVRYGGWEAGS
jgi:hypothetical protein